MEKATPILSKNKVIADRYTVQFFVGEVSNGQVYRAKDAQGGLVRLKIYNAAKLRSEHFAADGELLELHILQEIEHANIINESGYGEFIHESAKFKYLTTEFVSGESLEDKLKREGCFSPYSAVPIITELLSAIDYLHSLDNPIIHNAITLRNVVLDYSQKREKPILTNFLNARYFASSTKGISFEGVLPFYLAPETYNKVITPQSDVFATGALLYHMIMGVPPWHVDIPSYQFSDEKLRDAIAEARMRPLNFTMADDSLIDDHLRNTLRKALALDVDVRFKTAKEFMQALNREMAVEFQENKSKVKQTPTLDQKKDGGFAQIAGMQDLKDLLYNDVIRALNEKELYDSYGITIPNGMLLYGPPGCGKTFISEKFAEEVGFNFIQLKPSDIKSKYVNETEEKIGALFKQAIENAPTVMFFDEIDAIVPSREGDLHQMHASTVNELLAQMTNCAEKGIFIIAATNRPEKIDTAILRTGRIDRVIYIPPPDKDARESLFKLYLKNRPVDLAVDNEKLAILTENYVTSDIKFLIDEASRKALMEKSRITQAILEETISTNSPSVSLAEIRKYEAARVKLEGERKGIDTGQSRTPIGFKSNDSTE